MNQNQADSGIPSDSIGWENALARATCVERPQFARNHIIEFPSKAIARAIEPYKLRGSAFRRAMASQATFVVSPNRRADEEFWPARRIAATKRTLFSPDRSGTCPRDPFRSRTFDRVGLVGLSAPSLVA